jgi:hypothetical protein
MRCKNFNWKPKLRDYKIYRNKNETFYNGNILSFSYKNYRYKLSINNSIPRQVNLERMVLFIYLFIKTTSNLKKKKSYLGWTANLQVTCLNSDLSIELSLETELGKDKNPFFSCFPLA